VCLITSATEPEQYPDSLRLPDGSRFRTRSNLHHPQNHECGSGDDLRVKPPMTRVTQFSARMFVGTIFLYTTP